jgi:hypothetical protein
MFCVLLFDGKINKKNAQKPNKCEIKVFRNLIGEFDCGLQKRKK